jgi:NADH-quinone oxidoreductase subunit M
LSTIDPSALPLLQVLIVPLIFTPIVYAFGWKLGKKVGYIALIPLIYTTVILALSSIDVLSQGQVLEEYTWAPIAALKFGFLLDGISLPIALTVSFLCLVTTLFSIPYMEHKIAEQGGDNTAYSIYFSLYLLYAVGMIGTVLATNLIEFYLFYELMLIPSWALLSTFGYGQKERIGIMYFLWPHVGALSVLAGILATFPVTGSFEVSSMHNLATLNPQLAVWVSAALLLGFLVKMAVFGIHIWLPYAHAEAPTPISALLSPAMIGLGGYAIVRLVIAPFGVAFSGFSDFLSIWALITMFYGGIMALAQDDLKRLLAYSSISQMGYIFLGLASYTSLGVTGSIFQYVSHGISKCILFTVAGVIIYQTHGLRSISKLGGLAKKMPLTAVAALIGFLGIAGVPPLIGFQSEWILFSGVFTNAIQSGSILHLIIAIAAIFASVLTMGYGLWTIRRVFFGPLPEHLEDVKDPPLLMAIPLILLVLTTVIIGIYPSIVTDILIPAVSRLIIP